MGWQRRIVVLSSTRSHGVHRLLGLINRTNWVEPNLPINYNNNGNNKKEAKPKDRNKAI
jgi:hypothetical protein